MTSTSIYCTYLTTYSGNKLPPFYIGSTNVIKINNGYRGSVASNKYKEIWESEIITNPQLFKTKILKTYDTRKLAYIKEEFLHRSLDVVRSQLHINESYANGNFCATLESIQKGKDTRKNNTQEKKKTISNNLKAWHANKTLEEKVLTISKFLATMSNKIPEEKINRTKKMISSYTPEIRQAANDKQSLKMIENYKNKSPEEIASHYLKVSQSHLSRSLEEKEKSNEQRKITNANKPDIEKQVTSKKLSDSSKRMHANRTAEEKIQIALKTKETKKRNGNNVVKSPEQMASYLINQKLAYDSKDQSIKDAENKLRSESQRKRQPTFLFVNDSTVESFTGKTIEFTEKYTLNINSAKSTWSRDSTRLYKGWRRLAPFDR